MGGSFFSLSMESDNLCVVHSFSHSNSSHRTASHWVNTGYNNPINTPSSEQPHPSRGSIISSIYGPNHSNGMPTYVKSQTIQGDKPAWLGNEFQAYEANGEGIKNLTPNTPGERLAERKNLLQGLDSFRGGLDNSLDELQKQSFNLLTGQAAKAFQWEKDEMVADYDAKNVFYGRQMLLARRLVQAGTKFVNVQFPGWDMHSNIANGMGVIAPRLDKYLSLLISDLKGKGMNKDVMVICAGEFGRTYKVNANGGRDHWSKLCPLLLAGGDYEMGRVIGESDKYAAAPKSGPIGPQDITATIFDHFQIDPKTQRTDNQGRPRYFFDNGKCIL
jgi:hypothetical protein